MSDRRVTIGDVAAEAGVSVATVSKVINDRWGVAETTSERVRAVIEELGFQSSLVAQSLRSRSTKVIGVLVVDIEPFSAELLKGVARGIDGSGYELVVFSGCGRADRPGRLGAPVSLAGQRDVVRRRSPRHAEQRRRDVRRAGRRRRSQRRLFGASDGRRRQPERRRVATEHLLELGHRRIGFLAGRPDLESAHLRERGYRTALERAGIEVDPSLIRVGGYQVDTADEAARGRCSSWTTGRPRSSPPTT